jgi:chromosomal replication initiation ATPase DnaA
VSIIEEMHAAHKARLVRMSGVRPVTEDPNERKVIDLTNRVSELENALQRQDSLIVEQRAYIQKLAGVAADTNPKLEEVFTTCCKFYGVSPADMRGPSKAIGLPFRRQIFYFLAREYGHSLHQIGRHIHKDHSSVVYGAQKIKVMVETDKSLQFDIDVLRERIAARTFERRHALEKILRVGVEGAV